jgi:hypothetical protein
MGQRSEQLAENQLQNTYWGAKKAGKQAAAAA